MNTVAVIPARGGSKRIPRKNIRPFCGKPIIAYSIEAAQKTGLFDQVVVSTDDEEIAEVAKQYGAAAPFLRPAGISDDGTGVMAVVAHTLRELEKEEECPSEVCMIYATAPLMRPQDITAGCEKFRSGDEIGDGSFVFSAAVFSPPIFRAFDMRSDGTAKRLWPERYSVNSQDLPEAYQDAAQFCWGRRAAFLDESAVAFPEGAMPLLIPHYRVVDIDTPEDWRLAELLYQALQATDGDLSA